MAVGWEVAGNTACPCSHHPTLCLTCVEDFRGGEIYHRPNVCATVRLLVLSQKWGTERAVGTMRQWQKEEDGQRALVSKGAIPESTRTPACGRKGNATCDQGRVCHTQVSAQCLSKN